MTIYTLYFTLSPKIMIPYMITRLSAYLDRENSYFVNVTTGGFGLTIRESICSLEYLTGLLNSKLLGWFLKHVSTNFHGGYFAANKQFISQLPIFIIDSSNSAQQAIYDKLVKLVEVMLELHKKLAVENMDNAKVRLERQIEAADERIDALVYELYGLTEDEKEIVENSFK